MQSSAPLLPPRRLAALLVGAFLAALASAPAPALEWAEGRLQLHGFYETQVRGLARDWDASDDWDLAQWAHVLNLEAEAEIAPLGWGPFDLVTGFARVELRYDCVWTRACGLFPSANAYGDGAGRLPKRLQDGRRTGFVGTLFNGDTRPYRGDPLETFDLSFRERPGESREAFGIEHTPAFNVNFTSPGPDQELETDDDPAPRVFARYFHDDKCEFSARRVQGFTNGVDVQNLGPLDPQCFITARAAAIDHPSPFRDPATGEGNELAFPLRPAPQLAATDRAGSERARGVWLPNPALARALREGGLEDPELNFRQDELAWNRGAAQQDEKELKEIYLDLEMFESRLWLRIGKQNIVWGKTELFRTTDQLNPQDLALASLPSLEASRIPLWSARGVWSFYDVGPLQDLRLELAVNFDQHEPNDLGRCGEPYSPILVCVGSFGFVAHSLEGLGLAGVEPRPDPWEDLEGLEAGVRVEFRWRRFSFAITDFYGYADLPFVEPLFTYSRNVDPESGRPLVAGARDGCDAADASNCLLDPTLDPRGEAQRERSLTRSSVNQTLFHKNCAATVGFLPLDPDACGPALFNSDADTIPGFPVGELVGAGLAGNTFADLLLSGGAGLGFGGGLPFVPLNQDAGDGPLPSGVFATVGERGRTLNNTLSPQQQALLGCGPFYATSCDTEGLDLMNAEASFLVQSFATFDGTLVDWDTTNGLPQPGTDGFEGGPVATRSVDGRLVTLPGARGPDHPDYDPLEDGCRDAADHPLCASSNGGAGASRLAIPPVDLDGDGSSDYGPSAGQRFASEGAALSWNLAVILVANSTPPDADPLSPGFDRPPRLDEFDPTVDPSDPAYRGGPFRKDGCSFAKVQLCDALADFLEAVGTRRSTVRAGGNGRFGRRDFQWHGGSPLVLRFEKRNVLGFSVDFAEDVAKSNWSLEATWIEGLPRQDNDDFDRLDRVDEYNLTVSVDRPTFVNFLNANRTFFFNTQWFLQYVDGHGKGFPSPGPWNLLVTATVSTGYFQDRLIPGVTAVYDKRSNSGAFLPQIRYRWTQSFSATFGAALFGGRFEEKPAPVAPAALRNRVGEGRNKSFVENGLAPIRDRDELFLRVRYTF